MMPNHVRPLNPIFIAADLNEAARRRTLRVRRTEQFMANG
jgi:hypothetical protein